MGIESISSWTQVVVMWHIIQNNITDLAAWYNLSASLLYGMMSIMFGFYSMRADVNRHDEQLLDAYVAYDDEVDETEFIREYRTRGPGGSL